LGDVRAGTTRRLALTLRLLKDRAAQALNAVSDAYCVIEGGCMLKTTSVVALINQAAPRLAALRAANLRRG
jgi:hypothetical protein